MTLHADDHSITAAPLAQFSETTIRKLDASRDLMVALRLCDKAINRARTEISDKESEILSRISRHLFSMHELAAQLGTRVRQAANIRQGLARRVQNAL